MLIDPTLIPADQLESLIKEFLIQQASIDGDYEVNFQQVNQVKQLLKSKELLISFSELEESVGIVSARELELNPSEITFDYDE